MPDAHMTASEARRLIMKVISELAELACLQETLEQRIFERDQTIETLQQTQSRLQTELIKAKEGR